MKIHTAGSNTTGELGVQANEINFLVHTEIVAEEELYTYDSIKLVPSFGRYNLIWAENYDGSQALFMTGELNESKKFKQIDTTSLNGERILQVAPGFHQMFVLTDKQNIYSTKRALTETQRKWTLFEHLDKVKRTRIRKIAISFYYLFVLTEDDTLFECYKDEISKVYNIKDIYPGGYHIIATTVTDDIIKYITPRFQKDRSTDLSFPVDNIKHICGNWYQSYLLTHDNQIYLCGDERVTMSNDELKKNEHFRFKGERWLKLDVPAEMQQEGIVSIAANRYDLMALTRSAVWGRGVNQEGSLGLGHQEPVKNFTRISRVWQGDAPKQIASCYQSSIVLYDTERIPERLFSHKKPFADMTIKL